MHKYIKIEPEEIAAKMRSDPEFGMQVLALFAQEPSPLDTANFAEAGAENMYHEQTAPILHLLADDIIEALKG
jgi:hypothetical protein